MKLADFIKLYDFDGTYVEVWVATYHNPPSKTDYDGTYTSAESLLRTYDPSMKVVLISPDSDNSVSIVIE